MKEFNTEDLKLQHDAEYTMMKKIHENLYLSPEQVEILEQYNIDYHSCNNINELIFLLEGVIEDCEDDVLINLADILAERDYYENYNK